MGLKWKGSLGMLDIQRSDLTSLERLEVSTNHFAQGLNFYKLFWVFFLGCFCGVVVETLWCLATRFHYESRVGLVLGPFNLVYGLGAVVMTLGLYWMRNARDSLILIGGILIGSVVEYACSWVQQQMFGSVSWDYSAMPFNLNGRINLLYSLFWGLLALLWIKGIYPMMVSGILKIPNHIGRPLTWLVLGFMIFNTVLSACAISRWVDRQHDRPAMTRIAVFLDHHYPDEKMHRLYANMHFQT